MRNKNYLHKDFALEDLTIDVKVFWDQRKKRKMYSMPVRYDKTEI